MKIAIVGSGIAGLSCAHALTRHGGHQVTLFEAGAALGGHTNTVDVTLDGITHPVDTGFLVFNERTYPNLIRLFAELDVPTAKSEMSFSVSLGGEVEWAGTSLAALFAQPRNLLRPRFWSMLRDILRFNRAATAAASTSGEASDVVPNDGPRNEISLGAWLVQNRYSQTFRDWYLLPMAGAIWSCPTTTMLDYPFTTFVQFCHNHGLLQIANRPQWFTVIGGGREYVRRIAAGLADIRLDTPVTQVRRSTAGVLVQSAGSAECFDEVVLACHSDQAAALIDQPAAAERSVLAAIPYQPNIAYLHTDTALLPKRRRAWAAWNYLSTGPDTLGARPVAVSYLINRLQPLPFTTPVVVTLNPFTPPDPAKVIAKFDYAHPVFDAGAIAAQRRLQSIQGEGHLWFAGAWTGYGFHEDGLKSGLAVAAAINRAAAANAPHALTKTAAEAATRPATPPLRRAA